MSHWTVDEVVVETERMAEQVADAHTDPPEGQSPGATRGSTMYGRTALAAGAAALAVGSGVLASPAAAYYPPQPWLNYNATTLDRSTVQLTAPADNSVGYVYNENLDFPVRAGDVVTFYMDTVGQTRCSGYYPYVYFEVEGNAFTSYDDGTACPGDTSATTNDGTVSFTIQETGRVGYAQVYYYDEDFNGQGGQVVISDLAVNGEPVYFQLDPGPDPTPAPVPVATPYDASLSKPRPCRLRVTAYHDAALEGQVAYPRRRQFVTRVDGRVRSDFTLRAGQEGSARIDVGARTGRRLVTVRLENGQLLDRTRIGTRRC